MDVQTDGQTDICDSRVAFATENSFVYHFRSCRQSYIRNIYKKLISISKMYVSSEKNFFFTNAIFEQYLKLLVWAYTFKLISDKLHSTF